MISTCPSCDGRGFFSWWNSLVYCYDLEHCRACSGNGFVEIVEGDE